MDIIPNPTLILLQAIPFVVTLLLMTTLVVAFPDIALWLPRVMR